MRTPKEPKGTQSSLVSAIITKLITAVTKIDIAITKTIFFPPTPSKCFTNFILAYKGKRNIIFF